MELSCPLTKESGRISHLAYLCAHISGSPPKIKHPESLVILPYTGMTDLIICHVTDSNFNYISLSRG